MIRIKNSVHSVLDTASHKDDAFITVDCSRHHGVKQIGFAGRAKCSDYGKVLKTKRSRAGTQFSYITDPHYRRPALMKLLWQGKNLEIYSHINVSVDNKSAHVLFAPASPSPQQPSSRCTPPSAIGFLKKVLLTATKAEVAICERPTY